MFLQEISLDRVRDEQRRWLAAHGLLDRPWFVLGSAPNPTVPEAIASRAAIVCINNAGVTGKRMGLPPAGLTFRNTNKEWNSVAGCTLPLVLWMSNKNPLQVYWTKRVVAKATVVGEIRTMRTRVRRAIFTELLGSDLLEVGRKHKPSTGIFAVLYGLFVGVPELILGGVSMEGDGYSYGTLPGIQHHRDEDRFAMQLLARRYPQVRTTEAAVAEQTGLPLYR